MPGVACHVGRIPRGRPWRRPGHSEGFLGPGPAAPRRVTPRPGPGHPSPGGRHPARAARDHHRRGACVPAPGIRHREAGTHPARGARDHHRRATRAPDARPAHAGAQGDDRRRPPTAAEGCRRRLPVTTSRLQRRPRRDRKGRRARRVATPTGVRIPGAGVSRCTPGRKGYGEYHRARRGRRRTSRTAGRTGATAHGGGTGGRRRGVSGCAGDAAGPTSSGRGGGGCAECRSAGRDRNVVDVRDRAARTRWEPPRRRARAVLPPGSHARRWRWSRSCVRVVRHGSRASSPYLALCPGPGAGNRLPLRQSAYAYGNDPLVGRSGRSGPGRAAGVRRTADPGADGGARRGCHRWPPRSPPDRRARVRRRPDRRTRGTVTARPGRTQRVAAHTAVAA